MTTWVAARARSCPVRHQVSTTTATRSTLLPGGLTVSVSIPTMVLARDGLIGHQRDVGRSNNTGATLIFYRSYEKPLASAHRKLAMPAKSHYQNTHRYSDILLITCNVANYQIHARMFHVASLPYVGPLG